MKDERSIYLMGLPGAGKSTFLAALWCAVDRAADDCAYSLERYSGDVTHLNELKDEWLACKPLTRTPTNAARYLDLYLCDASGSKAALSIPDLSGESFLNLWAMRSMDQTQYEFSRKCNSALLLINANTLVKPATIMEAAALLAAIQPPGSAAPNPQRIANPWDPAKTPTQVMLIELLQAFLSHNERDRPLHVGVVISAWDVVHPGSTPAAWLDENLPLLSQYLRSNADQISYGVSGLSAQGGTLPDDAARLQAIPNPLDRIQVITARGDTTTDVSALLARETFVGNE